jgi:drug/metabolite transporter (DMT)-like permease
MREICMSGSMRGEPVAPMASPALLLYCNPWPIQRFTPYHSLMGYRRTDSPRTAHAPQGVFLALISAGLWGLTPVATKIALEGFTPEFLGFVRLAAAAVVFRVLAGRGTRWFVADIWVWLAGAGLGADFILYNYGVQRTAANVAGLVINIELLSTIAFAAWILGERLNLRRIAGGTVTVIGVLIVTFDGLSVSDVTRSDRVLGNMLVMLAGISWSLYAVAQRRTTIGSNLFQRLTPIFSVASVVTAPSMLRVGVWKVNPSIWPIMMFIVLATFGTSIVYWIYGRAQELVDVSVLSILLCAIPVFAVVFAYVFLRETLTLQLAGGGLVIVGGIVLTATEKAAVEEKSLKVSAG